MFPTRVQPDALQSVPVKGGVLLNLRWNIELRQRGQSPFLNGDGREGFELDPSFDDDQWAK